LADELAVESAKSCSRNSIKAEVAHKQGHSSTDHGAVYEGHCASKCDVPSDISGNRDVRTNDLHARTIEGATGQFRISLLINEVVPLGSTRWVAIAKIHGQPNNFNCATNLRLVARYRGRDRRSALDRSRSCRRLWELNATVTRSLLSGCKQTRPRSCSGQRRPVAARRIDRTATTDAVT
jgi:hypothetical protein